MVNYQNGKIYKLWSPSKNIVYIGSTTQPLCKRLVCHLSHYKVYNNDNTKLYLTSFLVLECEDYKIELVEAYPCNNKQQLEKKEGEHIRNNECCNKLVVGRTQKEYNTDNVDRIKAYRKQYNIDNADKISEYQKKYNTDNADKRKEYMKQYEKINAEKISERKRQYYLKKVEIH
jgi:hypothetical protein